ncbi:hypothetical protein GPECTOR_80g160 [Gonium pectorale]|uniref:Uncharacterized protein n=1 Tax=Gonium pectorale TaxID=33097 RepID=A0A150G3B2_GONPE|nr:hypothetical protein GPECTOR_80g160 [Gonium pectorale]|eukprot:KXZ43800.1 hypothetical protein GPECTOR_80g160 [Gonium pectorale]
MSGCRDYCVDLLGALVRHCPRLRSLNARLAEPGYEPYIGDLVPVLQLLGRCGGSLRLLDLAGCCSPQSEAALAPALSALSGLRALCLSNWQLSTQAGPALQRCPATALAHLNLRAVNSVTDAHLAPLLSANPGLRSLNVGCCSRLTDATLHLLGAACTRLDSLDVCYASGMSAQGVRAVASALPRLLEFGFSGFEGLRDGDVERIAERHPELRLIGIGGIPALTDAALAAVASHCPRLESLYAADLPLVTPAGLAGLLAACPRLRRLAVEGCPMLGRAGEAAALAGRFPYQFDGDMLSEEAVREVDEFAAAAAPAPG